MSYINQWIASNNNYPNLAFYAIIRLLQKRTSSSFRRCFDLMPSSASFSESDESLFMQTILTSLDEYVIFGTCLVSTKLATFNKFSTTTFKTHSPLSQQCRHLCHCRFQFCCQSFSCSASLMEGNPDFRAQPSRKRYRHDDPPFHFLPTSEIVSALQPSSRFHDHHSSYLMFSHTPKNATAATFNHLSSSAPVLQPMHPAFPHFAVIAHDHLSHHFVIPHSPKLTDRRLANTSIYNIALPSPNSGRAHRFC